MGYSVKWVVENLGITRDMLRYYEKEELLPQNQGGKYRSYSDKDIEKIWAIKLLIKIGFSAKEILTLMKDPKFDFDTVMANKVAELEQKHKENTVVLEFAKSIKLTGRIPTTSKIGSIKFDDFLAYAHENWNFYNDPRTAPLAQLTDTLTSKAPQSWSPDEVERIAELFKKLNIEELMNTCVIHGYCQVISDMQELGYTSNTVQRVVHLLHEYLVKNNPRPKLDGKITPQFIGKYFAPAFLGGDIAALHVQSYGKAGCMFIAQALAYYGGYDIEKL